MCERCSPGPDDSILDGTGVFHDIRVYDDGGPPTAPLWPALRELEQLVEEMHRRTRWQRLTRRVRRYFRRRMGWE